jgi:hypothetical protein
LAQQNFEDQFGSQSGGGQTNNQQNTSTGSNSSSESNLDPFAKMLRNVLMGQINPIPGM